jgi:hypothetical protein
LPIRRILDRPALRLLLEPQINTAAQDADGRNVEQRPGDLQRQAAVIAEMQRLRKRKYLHIPGHLRANGDPRTLLFTGRNTDFRASSIRELTRKKYRMTREAGPPSLPPTEENCTMWPERRSRM